MIRSIDFKALVSTCLLTTADFAKERDKIRNKLTAVDFALFCLLLEREMRETPDGRFDNSSRLTVLADAVDAIPISRRDLQLRATEAFLDLKQPELAIHCLVADALHKNSNLRFSTRLALKKCISDLIDGNIAQHGHELLIDYLSTHYVPKNGHRRRVIEIGTTRERVRGQQSTLKLAQLCAGLDLDFTTVDMDPANGLSADRQMKSENLPVSVVTSKGEDYLAQEPGPFDFVFLDAYDFDHGKHSGLRQSRYETFLGDPITDEQCQKMHLECAVSLVEKLAADGVICFDDTWKDEDGRWTAKGRLAMPYLLDNGFQVIEAKNNAALLVRDYYYS